MSPSPHRVPPDVDANAHPGRGEAQADAQWLVHCSPGRTLVARSRGEEIVLVKIFEQGSVVDAEQEAALARTLAQPGVVTYLAAGHDPVTNKPCVTMEYCPGENLERLVANDGPMQTDQAARIVERLARVLHDFHCTPRTGAPHGVVHRDVKSANVLVSGDDVVLMDLEHTTPRRAPGIEDEAPSSSDFTGGTHGCSPPESYLGAYPHPGFDVFGLGTVLFFLLVGCPAFPHRETVDTIERVRWGRPRLRLLRGQSAVLQKLVADCLAIDSASRPSAEQVAATLDGFIQAGGGERHLDRALHAIHAGEFAAAGRLIGEGDDAGLDVPRRDGLLELAASRSRLYERIGGAPPEPALVEDEDLVDIAAAVAEGLPRLTSFLRRFPRHGETLSARQRLARSGHLLLEQVLPDVVRLKMEARFDEARALLEGAGMAAAAIGRIPGGLTHPVVDSGALPGPLLRNPGQLLERSMRDVENTENKHGELIAQLKAAEADLDLERAVVVIDQITTIFGGASTVAAELKDRLHRLDFYLHRIARPQQLLDQMQELLDLSGKDHGLERVKSFSRFCYVRTVTDNGHRAKGGVRSLLETMRQVIEEFPHAAPTIAGAESALRLAMEALTSRAWECLADATTKLGAIPIPIRPVQKLLNRLDAIRMLETFLDLGDRSRERLQDEIERVRMRLDQARTARDNIARGAQEAMDKGHLTTALFDMARAVDHFEDAAAGGQLTDQLAEARRRKQELEHATTENHRLAARFVELRGDEHSQLAQRLAVLEERAAVLDRLIQNLGEEKGAHYQTDLREVMVHLVQEKADHGERQLDLAEDPAARLSIAVATLQSVRESATWSSASQDLGGRTKRVVDHWMHKEHEAREQVRQQQRVGEERQRRKRRVTLTWIAGVIVLLIVVVVVASRG